MKNTIIIGIAVASLAFLSGCADRETRTTTTTEESTVQHPVSDQTTTTETQTVRPAY